MGARVPSHGKNLNRLTKLTPALLNDIAAATSPRPSHLKRNSTNLALVAADTSTTPLRKNHSETSLKKNRSNLQLTKLTRGNSSKNVAKLKDAKHKRNSSTELKATSKASVNPTVRFNLADEEEKEDAWTEESASVSPNTTRSNTRQNSVVLEANPRGYEDGKDDHQDGAQSPQSPPKEETAAPLRNPAPSSPPTTPQSAAHANGDEQRPPSRSRVHADADRITSRLLNRNVSFTAAPKLSSVSATRLREHAAQRVASQTHLQSPASASADLHDATGLVSRFIHDGGPSSGTPHSTTYFPTQQTPPSGRETSSDLPIRTRSTVSLAGTGATSGLALDSRSSSHNAPTGPSSGAQTPTTVAPMPALHPSRTQQKLWLDRASSNMEAQAPLHPPSLLRAAGRLGSAVFPAHLHGVASEGRLHAHVRQIADRAEVEYRRVRLFQNPLAEAANRLNEAGVMPRTKAPARTSNSSRLGDGAKGTPQAHKASGSSVKPGTGEAKRTKVSFQGIKAEEDGHEEDEVRGDSAREICRRLWERQAITAGGD